MEKAAVWALRHWRNHPREALISIQVSEKTSHEHYNLDWVLTIRHRFLGNLSSLVLVFEELVFATLSLSKKCAECHSRFSVWYKAEMLPVISRRAVTYLICLVCRDFALRATRHLGLGCCKDWGPAWGNLHVPHKHLHSLVMVLHWFSFSYCTDHLISIRSISTPCSESPRITVATVLPCSSMTGQLLVQGIALVFYIPDSYNL